jgi:hypothetical protein
MKVVFQFSILLLLLILLLAGQANASYWFKVIDISPISLDPGSGTNFTVSVKGLGSHGAYVELVFRNKTQGLDISCEKKIKYVFPAGVTKYNCTVKATDIAPGNYSFVADVSAKGAPSGNKTGYIEVKGVSTKNAEPFLNDHRIEGPSESLQQTKTIASDQNSNVSQAKKAVSSSGALTLLVILLMFWRMR